MMMFSFLYFNDIRCCFCSCNLSQYKVTLPCKNFQAAVRQGLTGSLLPEKSCSSSAYHSPGRVVSPSGGDCASPSGLVSSPVRLPSIGEFFHPTSPQTRITSPHHFEYIVDKLPVSPPLLSCQDGTRNNSKAGLINTSKAASSVPLDVHIPTISSEGVSFVLSTIKSMERGFL
jgi:hypothetical protein